MSKSIHVSLISLSLLIGLSSAKVLQNNGIAGYTGSPGEQNCTACHSGFALNSGGGSISISTTPSITASGYVPGSTYTVDVTVAKTGISLFGFGTEILGASNTNAGTISVINSTQTKLLTSSGRTNVVHQLNGGAGTNTKTFSFQWVAPATAGSATIYAAGVAANGNNSSSSDYVYKASLFIGSSVGIAEHDLKNSMQLYPNPAAGGTTNLSYTLKKDAQVTCSLMTLSGQLITAFYSESQEAGRHQQKLTIPSSVSPGLYLLQLEVDGQSFSKRLIVD